VGVELVREVARECPLPINRETTLGHRRGSSAVAWELQAEARPRSWSATAILDNFCYLRRAAARWRHCRSARHWTSTYDFLFRVPIIGDPRFDGIRDTDLAFQHEIDGLIVATLGRGESGAFR
jgi:hypothetical protein